MHTIGVLAATSSDDNGFSLPVLVLAALVGVAWLLACGVAALIRRAPHVDSVGYTQDLPPETPAVAAMLADDFEIGAETAPATLLDLAARHVVTLEEVQPGRTVCRVRKDGTDLTAYERRVLDAVRERAIDGVVPTDALTTGTEDRSHDWQRSLTKEVIADAQARGLTRDRWPKALVGLLGLGVFAVGGLLYLSSAVGGDVSGSRGVRAGIAGGVAGATIVALTTVTGRMTTSLAQLPTDQGKVAAARVLGLRTHLRENEEFDDVPPAGVTIWGRHLAYATAMGAARSCAAALPFGAEDDRHAWSRYGHRWRKVRVRYPRALPPAWGKHPAFALFLAVVWGGVAVVALYFLTRAAEGFADETTLDATQTQTFSREQLDWFGRSALIACVPFVLVVVWALVVLVRAVPDLWSPRQVTGELVRRRARQQIFKAGDDPKYWYYLALDDGTSNRISAWRVRGDIYQQVQQGQTVTATVTSNLGYVREMA